jgi:Chain length determinant protein
MSEQSFNQSFEDEISLKDIIDFLVEFWKAILVTGFLGVLVSAAYLIVTPNQYQATAQIQMAQISASNNNTKPLGVNIEEPNLLMARLANSQSLVSRADKSGSALSAAYLAKRDEVKFLTEEILRLNTFITSADTRQAKLVSPIYA